MKLSPLTSLMLAAGILSSRFPSMPIIMPRITERNPRTCASPTVQEAIWTAAADKRARRASRNLANAGRPQGEML